MFPSCASIWQPGHALEAGWFLLQYCGTHGDESLQSTAIDKFIELQFERGWDKEHGGLFYFLDVDGHCPTQVVSLAHVGNKQLELNHLFTLTFNLKLFLLSIIKK